MTEKENLTGGCGWTGFAFGAHYEDGICCEDGFIWDLDSCDEPGGPLLIGGEHVCPQCRGTGVPVDGERGPMALMRQQAREEIQELLDVVADEDLRELLAEKIDRLFGLIRKLEEPDQLLLPLDQKGAAA
ncbi:MAG: hypothetical protein AAGI24_04095 [Pseudomonadota bacterium]